MPDGHHSFPGREYPHNQLRGDQEEGKLKEVLFYFVALILAQLDSITAICYTCSEIITHTI
jgi:hypothetical protein